MGKLLDMMFGPLLSWIIQMRQERNLRKNLRFRVGECNCSAHDITVVGMAHAVDCPMAD